MDESALKLVGKTDDLNVELSMEGATVRVKVTAKSDQKFTNAVILASLEIHRTLEQPDKVEYKFAVVSK